MIYRSSSPRTQKGARRAGPCGVFVVTLLMGGCAKAPEFLDEFTFYHSRELTLKVARYYENLPLHYSGEIYVVLCGSPRSADLPAGELNAAGWRVIGRGSAIGSRSASELAGEMRRRYAVQAAGVVVWSHVPISWSVDGCRTTGSWNPTTLPRAMIDPVQKPDYCGPPSDTRCAMLDFEGERLPVYSSVKVDPAGYVSFQVRSKAIRGGTSLSVSSVDAGRSWKVEPIEPAARARSSPQAAPARAPIRSASYRAES